MRPSKIILFQDDHFNPNAGKWVHVTLLRHIPMPRDFRTDKDVKDWAVLLSKYSNHGQWRLGPNSVTDQADTAYTVGTSAPQQEKYWGFSPQRMELDFFERHTMPKPEAYGETEVVEVVTVTLYEAWYGTNGLVSNAVVRRNEPRDGVVRKPSNILKSGLVRWDLLD